MLATSSCAAKLPVVFAGQRGKAALVRDDDDQYRGNRAAERLGRTCAPRQAQRKQQQGAIQDIRIATSAAPSHKNASKWRRQP